MIQSRLWLALLAATVPLARAAVGTAVGFCYDSKTDMATAQVHNLNTGAQVAISSELADLPGVISNTMSTSVDTQNKLFAVGHSTTTSNNLVHVFSYSASSIVHIANCTMPDVIFASVASPGKVHCVALSKGRLFVIYDKAFGTGIIAEVDMNTCTFTTLGTSPFAVKGSKNGPGGNCVAVPSKDVIAWQKDAGTSLAVFDYETKVITQATVATDSTWSRIRGSDTAVYAIQPSSYYIIDSFSENNTAAPSVGSAQDISALGTGKSAWDVFLDTSVNPAKFIKKSSSMNGKVGQGSSVLQTIPKLKCTGASTNGLFEYDQALQLGGTNPTLTSTGTSSGSTSGSTGSSSGNSNTTGTGSALVSGVRHRVSCNILSVVLGLRWILR